MVQRALPPASRRETPAPAALLAVALLVLVAGASTAEAAPNTTYAGRPAFEATLAAPLTDSYGAPPYPAGFTILDNATMSAVLGETDYVTTGFTNWNILPGDGRYCAGCNGSFRLSFQTTSVGTAAGVFGVGFDVAANAVGQPYHAFVTFADGSTQDFPLPAGASFFGITSPTLIRSIDLGGAGGTPTTSGSFEMDNLTIGAAACADMTPPTVTCALTRSILLPARNGMVPVGLTFSATDDTDPSPTIQVEVYSDEPVGPLPYAPDAALVSGQWTLRAERSWTGNGRVYLIVVKATDACGNAGYACCTAVVPFAATTYWILQANAEATAARLACEASGTGSPGAYTPVTGLPAAPPPTLTLVGPARVGTTGGRTVTLTGTGFTANMAGTNTVTIGGAPATGVMALSDTQITCVTPPGTAGPKTVVLNNANGMATLANGITYVTPVLWAGTAQNSGPQGTYPLYTINPATAAATVLNGGGPSLTGLAHDDATGVLYGIDTPFAAQTLYTIDKTTGAATPVGPLSINNNLGDLTFAGTTLVGNKWAAGLFSVNLATGAATQIGPNAGAQGQAMAGDWQGNVLAAFYYPPVLHAVNPATGAITALGPITGLGGGSYLNALAWLDGVLYGVENLSFGPSGTNLVVIDPVTRVATPVGPLPANVDSLGASVR